MTIPKYLEKMQIEIARVKALSSETAGGWKVKLSGAPVGAIYIADPLTIIPGIGLMTATVFTSMGILTVLQFSEVVPSDPAMQKEWLIANKKSLTKVGIKSIATWRAASGLASPLDRPSDVFLDHRLADNPYLSYYGNTWEQEIAKVDALKSVICVKLLVTHIYEESRKAFIGTLYENNWFFFHDALSLMTCTSTVEWMKEMGYYKHWILPVMGCNEHHSPYNKFPCGNSPECCCLDCHLNRDFKACVMKHIALTVHLPESDPRKFSFSTPNRLFHVRKFHPSINTFTHSTTHISSSFILNIYVHLR